MQGQLLLTPDSMMTSDVVPPGSKYCTFVFGQDTFKPIVRPAAENPDKHNSRSVNWDRATAESDALQTNHVLHDPVNGTAEEDRGKHTPDGLRKLL